MAAVTREKARPVTPTGYEVNDKGQAKVAIEAGQLVIITADTPTRSGHEVVWDLCPADAEDCDGMCLQDVAAGGTIDVGLHGEMDGYAGLTPGADLYPSPSVAGGIDTAATTGGVVRLKAVRATRIRFNFV